MTFYRWLLLILVFALSACASDPAPTPRIIATLGASNATPATGTPGGLEPATPLATATPFVTPTPRAAVLPPITAPPFSQAIITAANVQSVRLVRELAIDPGLASLDLSPDGHTIAAGHENGSLTLLRLGASLTAEVASEVLTGQRQSVSDLRFNPDGSILASVASGVNGVWFRDAQTGQRLYQLISGAHSLAFSPDGKHVALGGGDGNVTLWTYDRAKAEKIKTIGLTGHEAVCGLGFTADGTRLVAGYCDYTLAVWDAAADYALLHTLKNIRALECLTLHCDYLYSNRLALSPTGSLLASVIPDSNVGVWNSASGQQFTVLDPDPERVLAEAAAFSPDGKLLALTRWNAIFVIEVESRRLAARLTVPRTPDSALTALRFSRDGRLLVSGSNGKVQLWAVP